MRALYKFDNIKICEPYICLKIPKMRAKNFINKYFVLREPKCEPVNKFKIGKMRA